MASDFLGWSVNLIHSYLCKFMGKCSIGHPSASVPILGPITSQFKFPRGAERERDNPVLDGHRMTQFLTKWRLEHLLQSCNLEICPGTIFHHRSANLNFCYCCNPNERRASRSEYIDHLRPPLHPENPVMILPVWGRRNAKLRHEELKIESIG